MARPLTDKTALITGGGRGIGRATSIALAHSGARIVIVARSAGEIESVADEIRSTGGDATALPADVSKTDEVRSLFDEAGPIDILINNASVIDPIAALAAADPHAWLYDIAVNLGGVFLTCRYALPSMLDHGWGRIVNVSSGAARGAVTGWSAYSSAKAGVEAMTKILAQEVTDRGVRVNAIRPGIVDTEMQTRIRSSAEEEFGRENLARFRSYKERGLLRRPEDPAKLILWILSEEADDLNGEVLAIDDPEVAARVGLVPMGR